MNVIKKFQLADLIIQALLLANVSIPILLSVFIHPGILFWSMFWLLPLGFWQLLMAALLGFGLKDKFRYLYLITAITFSSLFFSVSMIVDYLEIANFFEFQQIAFFVGLFISFAGALYYFNYSYRYYRSGNKNEIL